MKKAVVSLIVTGMLVSLTACGSRTAKDAENIMGDTVTDSENMEDNAMKITAGDTTFMATLANNSSVEALKELLAEGPLTIDMSDYARLAPSELTYREMMNRLRQERVTLFCIRAIPL